MHAHDTPPVPTGGCDQAAVFINFVQLRHVKTSLKQLQLTAPLLTEHPSSLLAALDLSPQASSIRSAPRSAPEAKDSVLGKYLRNTF